MRDYEIQVTLLRVAKELHVADMRKTTRAQFCAVVKTLISLSSKEKVCGSKFRLTSRIYEIPNVGM